MPATTPRSHDRRIAFELDPTDKQWLADQQRVDGLQMSARLRALVSLLRSDSDLAGRVLQRADEMPHPGRRSAA